MESEKPSKWAIVRYIKRHVIYRKYFHKKLKGGFPPFIYKTDEERIQKHPNWLNYDYPVYITEKVDGTSATYFIKKLNMFNIVFGVCSRTCYQKTKRPSYYWQIAIQEGIEKKLKKARKHLGIDICIQGEIIGPKIQKNKYKKTGLEFYLYNVFDITRQEYFNFEEIKAFCQNYKFKMVPLDFEAVGLKYVIESVSQAVEYSKDQSKINPAIKREGIVVRSVLNQKELSFKVINPEFLLEYGE
jgi:RNA ligase (TIGR02306 family)